MKKLPYKIEKILKEHKIKWINDNYYREVIFEDGEIEVKISKYEIAGILLEILLLSNLTINYCNGSQQWELSDMLNGSVSDKDFYECIFKATQAVDTPL
jgi:hypothetical protein